MRKVKPYLFVGLMALCPVLASSQDEPLGYYQDALLFSQTTFGGTARIQALGGAQVALGGDQSSAASNPAGLGFFNRGTVVLTPSLNFFDTEADYLGDNASSFRLNFNFDQLGIILNHSKPATSETGYRGGSFAISLNRINNFNNEVEYVGFNNDNSIVDFFIEKAGKTDPDDLDDLEYAAYDQFLIDLADYDSDTDYNIQNNIIFPFDGDGTVEGYGSPFGRDKDVFPRQTESIRTRGGQHQINFSWGGNYSDRIYFGAGLGLNTINYRRERTYTEDAFTFSDGDADDLLNSITISDVLEVSGTGVNATVGLIARPIDFVTVGVSYVTPAFYAMENESFFTFITDWNSAYSYRTSKDTIELGNIIFDSDVASGNYNLRTPAKVNVGSAFFFGKSGFVSADVEFVDYTGAEIRSDNFKEQADNKAIEDTYRSVVNYRLGGEFRLDQFRFRAGYAYMADPYRDSDFDRSISSITFGAGLRTKDFFIDIGVVNRQTQSQKSPYNIRDKEPIARINNRATSAVLTVGFTF